MLFKKNGTAAKRKRLPLKKQPPQAKQTQGQATKNDPAARLLGLVFTFLLLFSVCEARLAKLALNTEAAAAVRRQSSWSQQLTDGRGVIYDHALRPLTGTQQQAAAAVTAGDAEYTALFDLALPQDRALLYQGTENTDPFVVRLREQPTAQSGIFSFSYPLRYAAVPLAQHIIGYCSGDGTGVSGMERAFDAWLQGGGDILQAECATDALSRASGQVKLRRIQGSGNALQLSLDSILQRICEDVAAQYITAGAIVMLECATGRIAASVSMPQYDPLNVAASIAAADTALINRSFSSYNVGSVYKPVLAALALERGFDAEETYECTGAIEVDGHTYRCARRTGHGEVDLEKALQVSCNCYFILLGQRLGAKDIVDFSALCGFGSATHLGGGYRAGSGNLPDEQVLANSGELAGLSFGQGQLTATPLQLAAAFNAIVNGGVYVSPTLVEGFVNSNTGDVEKNLYRPVQLRLLSEENAARLRAMLVSVVEEGLGAGAAIPECTVGGKTGTAQTGRTRTLADGTQQELYESWFVGFYPGDVPQYTVAVMMDSTTVTGEEVAPVFAALCRQLYYLQAEDLSK